MNERTYGRMNERMNEWMNEMIARPSDLFALVDIVDATIWQLEYFTFFQKITLYPRYKTRLSVKIHICLFFAPFNLCTLEKLDEKYLRCPSGDISRLASLKCINYRRLNTRDFYEDHIRLSFSVKHTRSCARAHTHIYMYIRHITWLSALFPYLVWIPR